MSISDWHTQALRLQPRGATDLVVGSAPLVAVAPLPVQESSNVELGDRLAADLAALTRVLLGPQSLLVQDPEPSPVADLGLVVDEDRDDEHDDHEPLAPTDEVEPLFVAPVLTEVEPLFVAPPIVEVEPLVAPTPPYAVTPEPPAGPPSAASRPGRNVLDELAFLDS